MVPVVFPDSTQLWLFCLAAARAARHPGARRPLRRRSERGAGPPRRARVGRRVHLGTLVHVAAATVGLSALDRRVCHLRSAASSTRVPRTSSCSEFGSCSEREPGRPAFAVADVATAGVRARCGRERAQPEDGALLPRVPTAVRRYRSRRCLVAGARARARLRRARARQRLALCGRRGNGRRAAPAATAARPALRLRGRLHRARHGRRARQAD